MTNRKTRVANAATPATEPVTEVIVGGSFAPAVEESAAPIDAVVEAQEWLLAIPINEVYTIGLTKQDNFQTSRMFLFDNQGGKITLGLITSSPQATESDILKAVKRLSSQIIAGISRNMSLL